jgi:hypothetical protein
MAACYGLQSTILFLKASYSIDSLLKDIEGSIDQWRYSHQLHRKGGPNLSYQTKDDLC